MKRVHLDEIEPFFVAGVNWKPLRHELGIEAFGINAYVAEPGELVVEPHTEAAGGGAGGHDELYGVVRGRATFTVDGESFDAPAGTFVFLKPEECREARAEEPGTTVIAMGGKPGVAYTISPWEYAFRGGGLQQRGLLDEARATIEEGLERYPGHPSLLYGLACVESVAGARDAALGHLNAAVEAEPRARAWAQDDADLAAIRDDPRFPAPA